MLLFTLLLTTIGVLLIAIYLHIRRKCSYWQMLGVKCDEPHWLYGNLKGVTTERAFHEIWQQYYDKYKGTGQPFAGFYRFYTPGVFVLEPDLIKNILIKDFSKFTDRGFYSNERDDPLTGQLFLLDGLKWKNMRNKLSPTFTPAKMKFMFPSLLRVGDEFIEVVDKMVTEHQNIVEVKELMARFTTDVIGSCAFGIECSSLKNPNAEFRIMGRRALVEDRHGRFVIALMASFVDLARKLHMKQTPYEIEQFFMRIVRETVEFREKNDIHRNDFMDLLIDLKNKKLIKAEHGDELTNLTIEEISAQAFVFFNAGYETSSTTMSFALYELAQNECVQERARQEVLRSLEKHNHQFTYECMKDLRYMEQIISETLRLHTVLPIINRFCLEDYEVPGYPNLVIKKGMPIIIPSAAIHRDERYYSEPLTFNPDNFTPDKVAERDSVLWLPFGDGPRNCIGMRFGKMQTILGLALLLKHFRFSVCPKTEIPLILSKQTFLLSSARGIYLKVTRV